MKSRKHLSKVVLRLEAPSPARNANAVCRAAILVLVLFVGLAAPSRGYAATLTVCASGCKYTTIAAAIAAAKPGSTISILDAVHTEWNITIDRNLTVQGKGAAKTAVDGAANGTVFIVDSGVTATFQDLTIRNGGGGAVGDVGGIHNDGTLTVKHAAVSGNQAATDGGIMNSGTLTVTNSTLSENLAEDAEGGIDNEGGTLTVTNSTFSDNSGLGGGAIAGSGTLTITNSTFVRNIGLGPGGISSEGTATVTNTTFSGNSGFAGALSGTGSLTVTNSTFSGNGGRVGGGIDNEGTLTVTNSTFVGNSAQGGGAIYGSGTIINSTFVGNGAVGGGAIEGGGTIINSTFAGNSAVFGGAIEGDGTFLKNTILAGNSGGNCFGTFTDGNYNISDDTTCGFTATGSRNSTNPLLDPTGLKNNGGPTQTIALDSESPAIDAIPLADCTDQNSNPIHTDQRGALRPDPGEVVCDIGAYEFQNFAGQANCARKSDSALVQRYGSLRAAASAYGFSTVKALNAAVQTSCGH